MTPDRGLKPTCCKLVCLMGARVTVCGDGRANAYRAIVTCSFLKLTIFDILPAMNDRGRSRGILVEGRLVAAGLAQTLNARGGGIRGGLVPAAACEARTHQGVFLAAFRSRSWPMPHLRAGPRPDHQGLLA